MACRISRPVMAETSSGLAMPQVNETAGGMDYFLANTNVVGTYT
jgi:hypothetical protein